MPILPLIDLLILLAWTSLAVGGALKLINIVFATYWSLLGFAPLDFFMMGGMSLVFAMTLIGRTWVKSNEPGVLAAKRAEATREAYAELRPEVAVLDEPATSSASASAGGWQQRQLDG